MIQKYQPINIKKTAKRRVWIWVALVVLVLIVLNLPVRSIESYTGQCQSCMVPELHPDYIVQPVWRWIFWRLDREFGDFAIDDPFGWR